MLKQHRLPELLNQPRAPRRSRSKRRGAALLLLLFVLICAPVKAWQGRSGGGSAKSPPKPAPSKPDANPSKEPRRTAPPRSTPAPRATLTAELTVKTAPAGCAVMLGGSARGNTGAGGLLSVTKLKPGEHVLIVSKAGYQKEERRIALAANQSQVVEVTLTPLPVPLSVTVSVTGAQIEVNGLGYNEAVNDVELPPGAYQVKVARHGYRTALVAVELRPAKPEKLHVTLERIAVEELTVQAEQDFRAQRHDRVITACRDILSVQPEQPRAQQLLGHSLFHTGQYAASTPHLVKALQLGETITLPVKHHHVISRTLLGQANDDLCAGQFVLRKGGFEFQAAEPSHSFQLAPAKIYELSLGAHKNTPRLHTRVGLLKGRKENKEDFNFFADRAALRKRDPNQANSLTDVFCQGCQPALDAVYQVLLQLKK